MSRRGRETCRGEVSPSGPPRPNPTERPHECADRASATRERRWRRWPCCSPSAQRRRSRWPERLPIQASRSVGARQHAALVPPCKSSVIFFCVANLVADSLFMQFHRPALLLALFFIGLSNV